MLVVTAARSGERASNSTSAWGGFGWCSEVGGKALI